MSWNCAINFVAEKKLGYIHCSVIECCHFLSASFILIIIVSNINWSNGTWRHSIQNKRRMQRKRFRLTCASAFKQRAFVIIYTSTCLFIWIYHCRIFGSKREKEKKPLIWFIVVQCAHIYNIYQLLWIVFI